jgi:hypothetical protein
MANPRCGLLVFVLSCFIGLPVNAYDYPLTESAIRDAYFPGTHQASLGANFLADYTRAIPKRKVDRFTSQLRMETPFSQVAVYASQKLDYSAQDAVEEFRDKRMTFRMYLDICYEFDAPPDTIQIRLIQNKKEIVPESYESTPYYPATDENTQMPSIGERIQMEFKAEKIDSSTLTIVIDTPDEQHVEMDIDLAKLR